MLIGVISDTHDNLPIIEKAIKKLNEENVALVLHAGDYVSPFVIPKFKALNAKLIGVFGNKGWINFLKALYYYKHCSGVNQLFSFDARAERP